LRRSIWDLRSRELEQFDLPTALLISGNQIADGANIRVEVDRKGTVRPLPETVEENILRVGQEAITNTVKHSGATYLSLELEYSIENVILTVKDNGNGFAPENCVGPNDGHFGLLGMSERAKRLNGKISITSAPGAGTTIRIEIPISETAPTKAAGSETPLPEEISYEENIPNTDSHR
jgi:signal transduction histidine kinase